MTSHTGNTMTNAKQAAPKKAGSTVRRLLMATTSIAVMAQSVFAVGSAQAHTDALGFLITPSTTPNQFNAQIFYGSWHSGGIAAEGSVILSQGGSQVGLAAFSMVPGYNNVANGVVPTGLVAGVNYFFPDNSGGLTATPAGSGIYAFQSATFTGLSAGSYSFNYAPGALSVNWTPSGTAISAGSFTITPSGDLGGVGGTTPNIDTAVSSYTTTQLNAGGVNPVFTGGTLAIQSGGTVTPGFTVDSSGGTIDANGQAVTFSGVFSDAGGGAPGTLNLTGTGGVTFTGSNTYTGDIYVNGPTLGLGTTTSAGTGTIHMIDPTINFAATGTYVNDISLEVPNGQQAADPTVLNNTSGGNITLSGRIYETAGVGGANQYVTFSGAGTTFLTNGSNSWGGVTTVSGGTTLSGTTASISGGSIVNNGTVIYTNGAAGTANQNISGSGALQVTGTGPVTLNGNITSTGQVSVSGAGSSLTLGGTRSGGATTGVLVSGAGATLTVANTGAIQSGQYNGVRVTGANATVNNLGTIQNTGTGADGQVGAGIYVLNGGAGGTTTVNNGSTTDTGAGSLIFGRNAGVRHEFGSTDTLVVNNYGNIVGELYNGVENSAGGLTVNNFNGGYIYALLGNGVSSASSSAVTVTNAGVIGRNQAGTQTVGGNGVVANGVLTVTNQTGGLIVGTQSGVQLNGGGSVTNAGTITGGSNASFGYGVQNSTNSGTVTITNQSGGVINGGVGSILLNGASNTTIDLQLGSTTTGQILSTNNGTHNVNIAGVLNGAYNAGSGSGIDNLTLASTGSMTSASLGGGNDSFLYNGGTFSGVVDAGAGVDSFTSNFSGSTSINHGALTNFESYTHQAGSLTLTGSGTGRPGWDVSGGNLILSGTLGSTGVYGVRLSGAGTSFSTTATGSLSSGVYSSVVMNGAGTTVGNLGSISNGSANGDGIGAAINSSLGSGSNTINNGSVTNATASLVGYINGVFNGNAAGATLTINNWGLIHGSNNQGVYGATTGSILNINNYAGGVISGQYGGVLGQGTITVTNAGTITSNSAGIQAYNGSLSVTNQTGGVISGGVYGIDAGNGVTLSNAGTISGQIGVNTAGGTITNLSGGAITGSGVGIYSTANLGLTNSGTITGTAQQGVVLTAGGTVLNQATGVIRGGQDAVQLLNTGTVTNTGQIHGGTDSFERGVLISGVNSSVSNQTGGQIDGWRGVEFSSAATGGSVNNAGAINGLGSAGVLFFSSNGTVQNNAGGSISGLAEGVYGAGALTVTNAAGASITGAAHGVNIAGTASVANAGQIHGGTDQFEYGVVMGGANSAVANQAGGVIDGWRGIQFSNAAANGTVSNAGTIQGFGSFGVIAFNTATIDNLAGGLITSNYGGVYAGGFLTLTNAGTITGGQYNGISALSGGSITNLASGVINAMPVGGWGILTYTNTTVDNAGVINADSGLAASGGVMTVTNTGTVNGTVNGLLGTGGVFDITNSGVISASNTTSGRGMNLASGVNTVTNQATGVISGWRGIELASTAVGSTITNAGSITGSQQGILSLAGGVSVGNTGTIGASVGQGVYFDAGGTLTNSGTITGLNHAFIGRVEASTVTNQTGGVMTGTVYNAVYTGGAGSVINNAGLMNGGNAGVYTDGANTSLTNTGTIRVTGTTAPTVISGVYMAGAGSSVTNSGVIESTLTDGRGVFLSGGTGTITNQSGGVISGNGVGAAIILTGTDYTVDLQSGSTVNGVIDASLSDGHNVLTVAGAANGGYVGGTGADDVTLMGGMTLTGVLNGMDGVDTLTLGGAANGALDTSVLGGFESRTMNGTGSWTLSGSDGDTSSWTLNAGELRLTGGLSVNNAAGVIVNAGATLSVIDSEAIGALSGVGSVIVSDLQTLLVGADDSSSTFDGVISGLGGLEHGGTGVLTLTGANTYTGATVVSSGTLQLGASGVIADGSDLSVSSGATLDLQGFNETVDLALISGTLNGTGTLTGSEYQLNGATVNANLGAGTLFNTGGVSVLNGTAASADVYVLDGTLTLGASDRLNDTAVLTIAAGATFDLDGHDETVGLAFINGTLDGFGAAPPPPPMPSLWGKDSDGPQVLPGLGNGTLTASQYVLNGATINGNLGAGDLFNIGGLSTLSGLVGAGNVTVQAGTLRLEADERLSNSATLNVASGAVFDLYGHNETVNVAVINGTLDGFGTSLMPMGRYYDKTVADLVEFLPGIGTGTLTATQYHLNGAVINGNLGAGTLFNLGGVSILNGTAGAGIVTVMAGTLQLGASNRLSDAANLTVLSGATLDLQSFSDTVGLAFLNGTLNGTGTLTASQYQLDGATVNANLGAGNLFNTGGLSVLNGTSNAANVVVQTGTLRLGASDRINNAADLSVSAGATFDLNGNMETVRGLFGSGNVTVGAGRLTFGGVDSGFGGVLSGAGAVVHTGNLFTLMGSHSINMLSSTGGELRYLASTTGNVSVSGGSMTGAGTIGGALTVSNGATLSPGLTGTNNGIGGFNVGSLVMNGGRLSLDVLGLSGGSLTDVIQVSGNANLTGGVLAPNFHGPVTDFNFSTRYLFLTAGSRTGTFANGNAFTADAGGLAGLYWRVRYDLVANGAVIELRQLTDFTGADGTINQNEVAGGLSDGQLEASDDWANVLSVFAGLDRDDQLAAFDSAGGEAIADISTSLFNANDAFLNAVRGASRAQAAGSVSMAFASTLGFVGGREGESAMVANVLGAFDPGAEAAAVNGGWISAYAGDASLEGKTGQAEVQTRLNGFAGGYASTQGDVTIGAAAGVTRVEGDVDQRASTYESDLTHGAAYMRFDDGTWVVGVTGSLYGGQVDSSRTITVGALTGVAQGSTDGQGQSLSASVSRRFQLDGDTMLAFGAETTASRIDLDGFTETGAGGLSLEVEAQSREWLTTVFSGRINRTYRLNGRDFGLYGGLGAMLTSGDRQALADMRFSGAATGFGDFTIEGAETAPVAGVADFGFEAEVSDSATVSLGYRGVFDERLSDHQVGARIQIRW
ncbi:MAG: hypothetical protein V4707_07840 [Pseudomonadota bacterium]